jgi:hypothetical protein
LKKHLVFKRTFERKFNLFQVSAIHSSVRALHQSELLRDTCIQQVAHRFDGVRRERDFEPDRVDADDEVLEVRLQVRRQVQNALLATQQRKGPRAVRASAQRSAAQSGQADVQQKSRSIPGTIILLFL